MWGSLYRKLCTLQTLSCGWHYALKDARDDFTLDPLGKEDYASQIERRLENIRARLLAGHYTASALDEIDVPKSRLAVRPGSTLSTEDAIVAHAILYVLAPHIDPKLNQRVRAYRLRKDWEKRGESLLRNISLDQVPFLKAKTLAAFEIQIPWYEAWPMFTREATKLYLSGRYNCLIKTDIVAYFENVSLDLLQRMLNQTVPRGHDVIQLLMDMLRAWSWRGHSGFPLNRGLPQGNEVSSFLSNLYLKPLDDALEELRRTRTIDWVRYVDDVVVFAHDEEVGYEVIFTINETLRKLQLNLQGAKTDIYTGKRMEEELEQPGMAEANHALERILDPRDRAPNVKGSGAKLSPLRSHADRIVRKILRGEELGKDERLFRRLLTVFGAAGSSRLLRACLRELPLRPDDRFARSVSRYFASLPRRYHDRVTREILRILEGHHRLFDYHRAMLIRMLAYLDPQALSSPKRFLRRTARSRLQHWYVRSTAAYVLSRYPLRPSSAWSLSRQLLAEGHPRLRRAGALLLPQCRRSMVNKTLASLWDDPDPQVGRAARFMQCLLKDPEIAGRTLKRMRSADYRDARTRNRAFRFNLWKILLLIEHDKDEIVRGVGTLLTRWSRSGDRIVRFHVSRLRERYRRRLGLRRTRGK